MTSPTLPVTSRESFNKTIEPKKKTWKEWCCGKCTKRPKHRHERTRYELDETIEVKAKEVLEVKK